MSNESTHQNHTFMKTYLFALMTCVALASVSTRAAAPDDCVANDHARRTATAVLKQSGRDAMAKYLAQNLRGTGAESRDIEVAQAALTISFTLANARDMAAAHDAGDLAMDTLRPYIQGKPASPKIANLLCTLGVFFEEVRYDIDSAQACYQAALASNPDLRQAHDRLANVQERKKARGRR